MGDFDSRNRHFILKVVTARTPATEQAPRGAVILVCPFVEHEILRGARMSLFRRFPSLQ